MNAINVFVNGDSGKKILLPVFPDDTVRDVNARLAEICDGLFPEIGNTPEVWKDLYKLNVKGAPFDEDEKMSEYSGYSYVSFSFGH